METTLGGLSQHVLIRGDDSNPLLLILHGGPGFAQMPLFTTYNSELEQHYLVVHWDQRGAGRSYSPDIPPSSMTLRQFVADTVELIEWLMDRFGQEKVYLLGHSWGSLLGATVASRYPEKVHAYIGVGQLVDGLRNEQESFEFTLRSALEQGDEGAILELREIEQQYQAGGGLTYLDIVVQRAWLTVFGGTVHGDLGAVFDRIPKELREEYYGARSSAAQEFSFGQLLPDILATDLKRTAAAIEVPVYFMLGRHDRNTPPELAVEYFDLLEAPAKSLHWFEESGHLIPFEEPARFNQLMANTVSSAVT